MITIHDSQEAFLGGTAIIIQAKSEDISNMFAAVPQQRFCVWIIAKEVIFRYVQTDFRMFVVFVAETQATRAAVIWSTQPLTRNDDFLPRSHQRFGPRSADNL